MNNIALDSISDPTLFGPCPISFSSSVPSPTRLDLSLPDINHPVGLYSSTSPDIVSFFPIESLPLLLAHPIDNCLNTSIRL